RRRPGEQATGDPVFVTELTLIDGGRFFYRGLDAVELSRSKSFEEVAGWLWTAQWGAGGDWDLPRPAAIRRAMAAIPAAATAVERFTPAVVASALGDDLRHDLSPAGVPVTGRSILSVLAASLPGASGEQLPGSVSERVWRGLSERRPTAAGLAALEAALVLAADHELAPSTLAARVAASFRADPYAVVVTGLGPASGSWQAGSTGAPTEVELMLHEAAAAGPERAIGERLRRGGEVPHGFGMPLYPDGDPRAAALLERLEGVGRVADVDLVRRLIDLGADRGFPPPNFDLGLGALAYCAGMPVGSGQAMFTLAKAAGWLAHAIEEYEAPTRFRSRADYVGARPEPVSAS
ncbi:MAG TPA: citrate/2-methylcitrate synthase, partial [Acidimicrobiales bacterium]|nr:citrate/2-methylcitrate synthase [Acidimicrobiales bacterium]